MRKNAYLIALFLLALSGLLLHLRIHPFMISNPNMPNEKVFNFTRFLATLLPIIDVVFVTVLFSFRKTAVYGYLLNGLIVIYGTVLMAHFSINEMIVKNLPLQAMVLRSTLPDIGIAWGDFFVGKALYDLYMKGEIS
jgi:hypothetical protein